MKNVTKKIVAFTILLALVTGMLMGCGGQEGPGKVASNGKSITVYAQRNGLGDAWLMNAAQAYRDETGTEVIVEYDALLSTNLDTTLENDAADVVDLYFVQTYEWGKWSYNGYLTDLTDFMNEKDENGKSLNDRMTATRRYYVDNDGNQKQTIVPLTVAPNGIAYNKEMMSYLCHDVMGWEEGHEYPINTKELYELIAAMEKVTAEGSNKELFTYENSGQTMDVKPFVWSGTVGMLSKFTMAWIYQYLGEEGMTAFYNQYDNCDMLNDEAFYVAYQTMMDLLKLEEDTNGDYISTTSIPNCISYNHTASQSQLLLGKALMCPTGSWFYSEMRETIEDDEAWGFMPIPYLSDEEGNPITAEGVEMPKNEDGSYANWTYINEPDYFIIPSRAKNPEEAKEFLRFLLSEEYMPKLQTDLQSMLGFEFDDSTVEKSAWFGDVADMLSKTTKGDVFAGTKMQIYGKIQFYYNPFGAPPFARLSQGGYGSVKVLKDSATGDKISSADEAKGIAVTENVYNYVHGNYNACVSTWNEARRTIEGN